MHGQLSTCAILDNWRLKCFGDNTHGQLGQGDTAPRGLRPGTMGDNLPYVNLGTTSPWSGDPVKVFDVTAGQGHFCALVQSSAPPPGGVVKCWGGGPNLFQCGELGYGDGDNRGVGVGGAGPNDRGKGGGSGGLTMMATSRTTRARWAIRSRHWTLGAMASGSKSSCRATSTTAFDSRMARSSAGESVGSGGTVLGCRRAGRPWRSGADGTTRPGAAGGTASWGTGIGTRRGMTRTRWAIISRTQIWAAAEPPNGSGPRAPTKPAPCWVS